MKKILLITLLLIGTATLTNAQSALLPDLCNVFGSVYETKNRNEANFKVFIETGEAFSQLVVYKADNKLFADKAGLWFFTPTKAFADYIIYFEKSKANADFSIYYTDTQSFATCK